DGIILYIDKFISNKPNIALIEYQKALSIFPEDDEIFEKFINFLSNINLNQVERSIYIKTYIKVLSSIGKFGKAINIITEIINANPNDIDNIILAANVYETEGHIDKAVNFYLQAIDKISNLEEKIKLREQISVIDPANRDNIIELVELYAKKREFESASKILRSLLRYNQNDPEVLYKIAEIDNLKGNYRGANIAIKRAIELDPLNPKYRYLLGIIHFYSGNKAEAEKILDQVIPELYQSNQKKELKEATNILATIKESYLEKYKEIIKHIATEEQKLEITKEEAKEEAKVENMETIIEEQITQQESKIEDTISPRQESQSKSIYYKNVEKNPEIRETLPKTTKKSTGIFIRKDTQEDLSKKTLLTKKENVLIKESTLGIKQSAFLKKESPQMKTADKPTLTKQDNPFIEKQTLEKPILEKQIEKPLLSKPVIEKNLEKTELVSNKPELTPDKLELVKKENIQEEIKSTVIMTKEDLIKEIEKEKVYQEEEKLIEVQVDTKIEIEQIKNIEIEMYENTLLNILSNFNSVEAVISNSIQLINNISQITTNKFRLFIWIYRILIIANTYNLNMVRQKLIEAIKQIGYEKSLEYISIPNIQNTDPIISILEQISISKNYEEFKYSIKEIIRYTINNNYVSNFVRLYTLLIEKYPDKEEEIKKIYIDVLNEEKNIDFIYIFLKISSFNNIELLNMENIELLLNNVDYSSVFENISLKIKGWIIINAIKNQKISIVEKLIKKTSDITNLLTEIYSKITEKIMIDLSSIEDINIQTIILPFTTFENSYDIYLKLLENNKLNKNIWTISYLTASNYPCLVFMKFEEIKKYLSNLINIIKESQIVKNNLKNSLIQIIGLIINNNDQIVINNHINKVIENLDDPNDQFMISLIQCWYNKNINPEFSQKITEKLQLIIDEIKETELIEFYKTLTTK
ncbi:MAG: hypothetical protein N2169_04685, partial [bacterium]|nr:hypothetical protein [bacterium]